ncbi:hypothetical protein LOTGIDRAFT_156816 [Lottia gigantea]|uniref:U4/U6.U5 tri-snRNP-associated protein 1 n=1 Tax=Lottia gigantea TaxID=225164 RepID=V4CKV1_LOTGI|nr:hypothetical protein LOTGIDRAFT_156816 [Lottia gigantea]ESP02865.1 hypothetical protein LOTGIDRAFT_156816 [Lottia gigantea]
MGTTKKHKDKDREHKRKHKRDRSRSRDRDRSDRHRRREKRSRREGDDDNDIEYIGTTNADEPEVLFEEPPRNVVLREHPRDVHRDSDKDSSYREHRDMGYRDRPESGREVYREYPRNNSYREDSHREYSRDLDYRDPPREAQRESNYNDGAGPSVGTREGGAVESLSIDETNRLRAKLGLKPLDVGDSKSGGKEGGSKDNEDVHAPAVNWSEQKKTESLREKMAVMREKRLINQKLGKVKTLGESDSDDDGVLGWVKKSRQVQKEKDLAAKRAKLLEEMDEEFGIGNLVEEEFKPKQRYSAKDLKGLKVQHDASRFKEGKSVILTLKDKGILDKKDEGILDKEDEGILDKEDEGILDKEDEDDELINVNMLDDEATDRNLENKKKKPDYKPYDEPEYDEYGMQSLTLSAPQLANEYYTPDEMEAKFKKVKKKVRKIRSKALKADDLLPLPEDEVNHGRRDTGSIPGLTLVTDPMEVGEQQEDDVSSVQVDDDAEEELQSVLSKARKLKHKKDKNRPIPEKVAELVTRTVEDENSSDMPDNNIILNSTSEFCRNLGEIPTYGLAGNREEDREEIMDMELELLEQKRREEDEDNPSGWNEVDIDDQPADIMGEEKAVLEEEPIVSEGVGAALQLAMKKGYLEKEQLKMSAASKKVDLEAKNYSIEDKRYDDLDEKFRKRDRYAGGVISEFKDKDGYKPDVKLEYVDDKGRCLDPKEAFRQLSHRFHGKGSGKRKTEKRNKKLEEEQLMKQMSSTDTPLNTLSMLQDKQKTEKSAFIILSGNKGMTAGHSIMKSH